MILLTEERTDGRIKLLGQHAGHNSQGLGTVVRLSLIVGRLVIRPRPILLMEDFAQTVIGFVRPTCFCRLIHQTGHVGIAVQSDGIPQAEQKFHILVVAPVTPCPSTLAGNNQSVGGRLPDMDVFLHFGKHVFNQFLVARPHIVRPESIIAHTGQHLHGQFVLVIAGRHRGKDRTVRPLPVHQLTDAFARQPMCLLVQGIKSLAKFIHHVAPPLRPLPVGAIHVGVAHRDVECTLRLRPQAGQERIVTPEIACKIRFISCLAIFQFQHLTTFRNGIDDIMPIHPSTTFKLLNAFTRNIFGKHIRSRTTPIVIRTDVNLSASH